MRGSRNNTRSGTPQCNDSGEVTSSAPIHRRDNRISRRQRARYTWGNSSHVGFSRRFRKRGRCECVRCRVKRTSKGIRRMMRGRNSTYSTTYRGIVKGGRCVRSNNVSRDTSRNSSGCRRGTLCTSEVIPVLASVNTRSSLL